MRATLLLLCLAFALGARGQTLDPLATADPLELARGARRLGDEAVLERLSAGATGARLGAVRAAPWIRDPLAAIEALAGLAAGDDPRLAPAASLSLWRIARGIGEGSLEVSEGGGPALRAAVEATAAAAGDESLRADLRALLADAEGHLRAALVQPVEP